MSGVEKRWLWLGAAFVGATATPFVMGSVSSETPTAAPLPSGPPTVVVTMREQAFDYDPTIPAGRVVFRVPNAGKLVHRLAMVPLHDDLPPIKVLIDDDQRTVVGPFAAVRPQAPGGTGTFAADLVPGARYAMVCLVRDVDARTHAEKGMVSEFRAGTTPSASSLTSAP